MSLKSILLSQVVLLVFAVSAFGQTVTDNDDIVGWSDANFIIPLKTKTEGNRKVDQISTAITVGFRMGRDLHRPIDQRIGGSLTFRLNNHFSLTGGYLYHRFRPTELPVQHEQRLVASLNYEKRFSKVIFRNRSTFSSLLKHTNPNSLVFRNRAQLSIPILKDKKELFSFYVSDEPIYSFKAKTWVRNDINIGISKQFNSKIGADFYYLHQRFSTAAHRETNGFGISIRYLIRFNKQK